MKSFKVKLHDYRKKIEDTMLKKRIRWNVFKIMTRMKLEKLLRKLERKLGFKPRCSLCNERFFCEEYACKRYSKNPFHVDRCGSKESQR